MNNKEFKKSSRKLDDLCSNDILYDKYNFTEFAKEPYMQGGLRTKKLVEIGEEILKNKNKKEV